MFCTSGFVDDIVFSHDRINRADQLTSRLKLIHHKDVVWPDRRAKSIIVLEVCFVRLINFSFGIA